MTSNVSQEVPIDKDNKSRETIYGVFDLNKSLAPLGDFLGLLQELLIISTGKNYKKIIICFIGGSSELLQIKKKYLVNKAWYHFTESDACPEFQLSQILLNLITFDSYYVFFDQKALIKFLNERPTNNDTWPLLGKDGIEQTKIWSSAFVQKQFKKRFNTLPGI